MVVRPISLLIPILLASSTIAGLLSSGENDSSGSGSSSSSSSVAAVDSSSSSSSASSASTTSTNSPEVDFLLTLQAAQITSMSCLITLVNLTYTPIGTCLGLTDLASLISNPYQNASFSTQLDGYLTDVCTQNCAEADIKAAKADIDEKCDRSNGLVGVLGTVLDKYTSSYKTMACQVHFNGTSDLCLPSVLNTSTEANSNSFFDSLFTGTNLEQYRDTIFTSSKCTGCMHEIFKAAQYTIPDIRGHDLTNAFGYHLQNDCASSSASPEAGEVNWGNTMDQQIPDALVVSQNTNPGGPATSGGIRRTRSSDWGWKFSFVIVTIAALGELCWAEMEKGL